VSAVEVVETAFYCSLAAFALYACWRDPDLSWVGIWLALNTAISNLLYYGSARLEVKVGAYTLVEAMVALAAFCAWGAHRRWQLVAVVIFAGLSVASNAALASIISPTPRQVFLWASTTNACFAVECLLASWVGVSHGYRTGRFDWWSRLHWPPAQPDVARSQAED
jgi:hypothetical protein